MRKGLVLFIVLALLLPMLAALPVDTKAQNGPKVWWVAPGGTGDGSSEDNPAGNITYAVLHAKAGDIIKVKPGHYSIETTGEGFPITLGVENLVLESTDGPEVTIINATGTLADTAVGLYAAGTVFRGFTVTYGNETVYTQIPYGIDVAGSTTWNVTIENNIVKHAVRGIQLRSYSGAPPGVNALVRNNTIIDATWYAIRMESYNNIAENNIIIDSSRGIQLSSVGNIVRNNYISNMGWVAVHCRDEPKDAVVVGNVLVNCDDVIYFNGGEENITIVGNVIAYSNDGIEFEGESTNITITYNDIRHNGRAIYVHEGVKNMVVQYNNIVDNGFGINNLSNKTEHQIDARYNWWGIKRSDEEGRWILCEPSDMVSSNVLYDPWATLPWPRARAPLVTVTTTVTETTTEVTTETITETTTTTTTETKEVLGSAFYGSVGVIIILIIALAYVLMRK